MGHVTTRWAIPYPDLSDGPDGADVPYWMQALAVSLDDVAKDDQGTLSVRPVSTPSSPGKRGRYYMVKGDAAPANNGVLWRDNGTGWDAVGTVQPNSVDTIDLVDNAVTLAKMADNSVGAAEIIDGSVGTAELADASVTGAKVAAALKASGGAGGGTEALRALGTAAGTAAAGTHAAQHGVTGADPILALRKYAMGLTITIPAAGSYWVAVGCSGMNFGASQNVKLEVTAGGITLSARAGGEGGGTEGIDASPHDEGLMTGLTNGQVLTVANNGNVAPVKPYIIIERMA